MAWWLKPESEHQIENEFVLTPLVFLDFWRCPLAILMSKAWFSTILGKLNDNLIFRNSILRSEFYLPSAHNLHPFVIRTSTSTSGSVLRGASISSIPLSKTTIQRNPKEHASFWLRLRWHLPTHPHYHTTSPILSQNHLLHYRQPRLDRLLPRLPHATV